MPLEVASRSYGTHFPDLSHPERVAAIRYIDELSRRYPDVAVEATAGPGNENTVYVYASMPAEDEKSIEIHEVMADAGVDILMGTGVSIALMPAPE